MQPKQIKPRLSFTISQVQKELFEKAATLSGYLSIEEFVLRAAEEEARKIIARHERLLSSQHDSEVFFDALLNPARPNQELSAAAKAYKTFLSG